MLLATDSCCSIQQYGPTTISSYSNSSTYCKHQRYPKGSNGHYYSIDHLVSLSSVVGCHIIDIVSSLY